MENTELENGFIAICNRLQQTGTLTLDESVSVKDLLIHLKLKLGRNAALELELENRDMRDKEAKELELKEVNAPKK